MTKFTMEQIVSKADESKREEARELGINLMRKYVLPNLSDTPAGQIFFSEVSDHIFNWNCYGDFDPSITIYGYFSPTEVPDYKSPYKDVFVFTDESGWKKLREKHYTEIKQKEKTNLSRKVIRKMKKEELERMCDHAFDEENLVGYSYNQKEDEKTGLISFKARFDFV